MQAKDVMTTPVVTVTLDTPVATIAKRLIKRRISAVPVAEADGQVVGIVSEGDLMNRPDAGTQHRRSWWLEFLIGPEDRARDYVRAHGGRARDVMARKVVTVTEDAPLADIAATLEKHRVKRVPVVRKGKLVGIVSRANLLQGLAAWRPKAASVQTDRKIREALLAAMKQADLPMHLVNVVVSGGFVRIYGSIDTEVQRQAARVAVENTAGVKALEDNLVIMPELVRAAYGGV